MALLFAPKSGQELRGDIADVTRKGIEMIGDIRTDALHEALSRAPIEDDTLLALLVLAFAGQNVYLYCASEGLATVFRGALDSNRLGRALQLGEGQFVTFAQTVGYPALA